MRELSEGRHVLEEVAEAVRVVAGTRGRARAERRLADVLQVGDAGDSALPEGQSFYSPISPCMISSPHILVQGFPVIVTNCLL